MIELTKEELRKLIKEEEEYERLEAYREWMEHNPYPHGEEECEECVHYDPVGGGCDDSCQKSE